MKQHGLFLLLYLHSHEDRHRVLPAQLSIPLLTAPETIHHTSNCPCIDVIGGARFVRWLRNRNKMRRSLLCTSRDSRPGVGRSPNASSSCSTDLPQHRPATAFGKVCIKVLENFHRKHNVWPKQSASVSKQRIRKKLLTKLRISFFHATFWTIRLVSI